MTPSRPSVRVLVVASELPPGPGGIGTHAHQVAVGLAGLGHEVHLLASQDYATDLERRRFRASCPVPIVRLPDGPDPLTTARRRRAVLRRSLEQLRPDVVVASGGRVLWFAVPTARRAGVPVIAVVHGTELGGPAWQRRLTRAALDRADRVVAVSRFTAGLAADLGVRRPDVIPNGADATRFAPDPDRRRGFRDRHDLGDRPVVLTVGNVTERKGQHRVVDALPELIAKVPDVVYVAVGPPTDGEALRSRARRLGVADHLVMTGQLEPDAVVAAHAAADVFAMTSTSTASGDVEGFGIAVVEAALSGVPGVVSTGTGAAEAVVDGRNGLVVSSEPRPLAAALAGLLRDEDRRAELGRAARTDALAGATWAHRVDEYAEVIEEVTRPTKPRIVVVSHTEHYRAADGTTVAFGPTTRELDHLATLASELVHVAPLHPGPAPGMVLTPSAPNLRHAPVPPAGGPRPIDRLYAIRAVPTWIRTIDRELRSADVAHVRCPAGISSVALLVLLVRRKPTVRWVKYAGNWSPDGPDAVTYRAQRWWLRRGLARATVTVNGRWPDQPPFVRTFDNPTLTGEEVENGRRAATTKAPGPPYRVVFAGRLEEPKGAHVAVEAVAELRRRGLDVELDLVGDGPLRPWVEDRIADEGSGAIRLQGWVTRPELEHFLAAGHAFLLPTTSSEGFPKVLGEAMAFGCVPVTTGVSSIGQVLGETGGSVVVDPATTSWADALEQVLVHDQAGLRSIGLDRVERFSYSTYLRRVREVLGIDEPPAPGPGTAPRHGSG